MILFRRKLRCSTLHTVGAVLQSIHDTSIILSTSAFKNLTLNDLFGYRFFPSPINCNRPSSRINIPPPHISPDWSSIPPSVAYVHQNKTPGHDKSPSSLIWYRRTKIDNIFSYNQTKDLPWRIQFVPQLFKRKSSIPTRLDFLRFLFLSKIAACFLLSFIVLGLLLSVLHWGRRLWWMAENNDSCEDETLKRKRLTNVKSPNLI